ncbi:MAG: hypothetical protein QXP27_08975 [Candidatus Methanomethyliaceae archaeon]
MEEEKFYHDVIVERSWKTALFLREHYDFIMIGGWAVWLYTNKAKSRDIDIIVTYETLNVLKREFTVRKNERLKKYEIKADGFDIDIYLPYYSTTLAVPPEIIMQHTTKLQGFVVPEIEVLLILKLGAWKERQNSAKGEKDLLDLRYLIPLVDAAQIEVILVESGKSEEEIVQFREIFNGARQKLSAGRARRLGL